MKPQRGNPNNLEFAHRIGYGKVLRDDMGSQLAGGPPTPYPNPPTVS